MFGIFKIYTLKIQCCPIMVIHDPKWIEIKYYYYYYGATGYIQKRSNSSVIGFESCLKLRSAHYDWFDENN